MYYLLFSLQVFGDFPATFLLLISSLFLLWLDNILYVISILLKFLSLLYSPGYGLYWYMFRGHLKRMRILLLLGGLFYKCLSDPLS